MLTQAHAVPWLKIDIKYLVNQNKTNHITTLTASLFKMRSQYYWWVYGDTQFI